MMEFGLFSIVVGLLGFASFIWLVVVAFRESLIWGFLVFLFSPISAIAFSVYHWDEAKKPFLAYLTTMIVFFALFFNAFNQMGGMEMISTTREAAKQLEKGEITEEEAARRVADQAGSSIKRMEEAGVIGIDERKMLEQKVQELKLDESGSAAETAPAAKATPAKPSAEAPLSTTANPLPAGQPGVVESKKAAPDTAALPATKTGVTATATDADATVKKEEKLEYGPEWSLEAALEKKREKFKQQQLDLPSPKVEGRYVAISVSRAEDYIGQQVRVVKAKTRHDGLLKSVNENFLILDMQVSGGEADFEIKRHQIQSMYQLVIPSPQ